MSVVKKLRSAGHFYRFRKTQFPYDDTSKYDIDSVIIAFIIFLFIFVYKQHSVYSTCKSPKIKFSFLVLPCRLV